MPSRQRFLVVTFTRAARDELLSRLDTDSEFTHIRDYTEITTLNSWGFRRIRNAAFSPRLITSKSDYHFATLNQLQPVWQKYEDIRNAITSKDRRISSSAPRALMNMLDSFKSLGFDHERHIDYTEFSQQWSELDAQGLGWRLSEQIDQLVQSEILDNKIFRQPRGTQQQMVYDVFYEFWLEAVEHLIHSATFTLEDQKYFAYLDERRNMERGSFLSGAASYNHVFVDEFQDINPLDLALAKAIVERNRATLTIAGDDDQAIFEWRGATPEYILNPDKHFGMDFSTHTLGVNYRSPANVVERSQRLIAYNTRRVPKQIESSDSTSLAHIEVLDTHDLGEELDIVQSLLDESVSLGESPSRMALIGRKRSQIIPYQVYFASKDIPFSAAEDLQVFLSEAFERLLELLDIKARVNEGRQRRQQVVEDLIYLCNLVKRYPLSRADTQTLRTHLQRSRPTSIRAGIDALSKYRGKLKGNNPDGNMSLDMADCVRAFVDAGTVSEALLTLSKEFTGLQFDFGKAEDDIFFADPPFLYLAQYAQRYGDDYESFIDDIELAKDTLVYVPPVEDSSDDSFPNHPLHLMTALRAKGKEFDTVVLLGMLVDIWPNKNAQTPAQLEAERRVFYVAFTRARKRIAILTNSISPSPYIEELGLTI